MTPKESKDAIDKKIAEEKKKLDAIEEKLKAANLTADEKKKLQSDKDEIINMIAGKNTVWEIVAKAYSDLAQLPKAKIEAELTGEFIPTGVDPTKDKSDVGKAIKGLKEKFETETDAAKKRDLSKHITELQKILGKLEAASAADLA